MSHRYAEVAVRNLALQASSYIFVAVGNIVLARAYGPTGRGQTALVLAVAQQLTAVATLGVPNGIVHFVGRDILSAGSAVVASIQVLAPATVGAAAVAVALVLGPLRDAIPGSVLLISVPTVAVIISLEVAAQCFQSALIAVGRLAAPAWIEFVSAAAAMILALAFGLFELSIAAYIAGRGAVSALAAGISWSTYRSATPRNQRNDARLASETTADRGMLFRFGLRGYWGTLLQTANYRLDQLVLGTLVSAHEVGIYFVAVAITETLWIVPQAFAAIVMSTSAASNGVMGKTPIAARMTAATTSVLAAGIAASAPILISVGFGTAFAAAATPLRILLPGAVALAVWKVLINGLTGEGVPTAKSWTAGVAVLITIALDVALVPRFGATGAAFASTASYVGATMAAVIYYRRRHRLHSPQLLLPRRADCASMYRAVSRLKRRATA